MSVRREYHLTEEQLSKLIRDAVHGPGVTLKDRATYATSELYAELGVEPGSVSYHPLKRDVLLARPITNH